MKKLISSLLILVFCFSFSGCTTPKPKTYVHGDWEVIYNEDGTCTIYDFSEEGKQKEVLVFPEEVAGREVIGTYYVHSGYYTNGHNMYSSNLRKLYFTKYVYFESSSALYTSKTLSLFCLYELEKKDNDNYLVPRPKYTWVYVMSDIEYKNIFYCLPANVVYYFNYDNAPNKGCYWIDDYDGQPIMFIPENPTRDGYEFVGWYKEPECITKWDFKTDTVPKKIYTEDVGYMDTISEEQEKYIPYETKLFAKWKINKGE